MLPRLGCLFVVVPLLELILLIQVGRWVGILPTVVLIVGTGVAGAFLARREGLRALAAVQTELAAGRMPAQPLLAGAAVLIGGAFLLTPGLLTDIAGFLLLVPSTRGLVFRWMRRHMEAAVASGGIRVTQWGWIGVHHRDRAASPGGETGRRYHGRAGRNPFEFDANPRPDDESPGDRPPRPGEIIQD